VAWVLLDSPAVPDDRDCLRAQLGAHGDRLREAQATDRQEHAAIADLLPRALEAGLSKSEIAELAGVGRPWINRTLRSRHPSR
jgi:hypothetical protein